MLSQHLERLRSLAEHLPFHVEDVEAVGKAFIRWFESKDDADFEVVELWLYCFSNRYVLLRLLKDSPIPVADVDAIQSDVFLRTREQLDSIRDPDRFVHWVRVVVKRAYLNRKQRAVAHAELHETSAVSPDHSDIMEMDRSTMMTAIREAIDRLPDSLKAVAIERFLKNVPYPEIAEMLNMPINSVRTYTGKAKARLCSDPEIIALARDFAPDLLRGLSED